MSIIFVANTDRATSIVLAVWTIPIPDFFSSVTVDFSISWWWSITIAVKALKFINGIEDRYVGALLVVSL